MRDFAVQHSGTPPSAVNQPRLPTFNLSETRCLAIAYPEMRADASDMAKRFFPAAGSLARWA